MVAAVVGFESDAPLSVSQVRGERRSWDTLDELVFHGRRHTVRVPRGSRTDWASVPPFFQWLINLLLGAAAAVLHDYLCRVLIPRLIGLFPPERMTYRDADEMFRDALLDLDVGVLRAWLMWAAVRWHALTRPGGARDWAGDAPAVLAITVLALPVMAPSVVNAVYLLVFDRLDQLVSLPGQRARARARAERQGPALGL